MGQLGTITVVDTASAMPAAGTTSVPMARAPTCVPRAHLDSIKIKLDKVRVSRVPVVKHHPPVHLVPAIIHATQVVIHPVAIA